MADFLDYQAVSRKLGVSVVTVRRLVANQPSLLPKRHIGKRVLFTEQDVNNLMERVASGFVLKPYEVEAA